MNVIFFDGEQALRASEIKVAASLPLEAAPQHLTSKCIQRSGREILSNTDRALVGPRCKQNSKHSKPI